MAEYFLKEIKARELQVLLDLSVSPQKFVLRKKNFYKRLKFGDIIFTMNFLKNLRKGTIAVIKGTQSSITHVKMYVGDGKTIDAQPKKGFLDYEDLMDMKNQVLIILRADLTPSKRKKLKEVIKTIIGGKPKYDFRGVIGITLCYLTGFFPKWLEVKENYFCSELVYECYLRAGIKLGHHRRSEFVSPIRIFESDKLHVNCILDGVHGFQLSKRSMDSNKKIKRETLKLLLNKIK